MQDSIHLRGSVKWPINDLEQPTDDEEGSSSTTAAEQEQDDDDHNQKTHANAAKHLVLTLHLSVVKDHSVGTSTFAHDPGHVSSEPQGLQVSKLVGSVTMKSIEKLTLGWKSNS